MRTVYKYDLEIKAGQQKVWMPKFGTIIAVEIQRGKLCIWYEHETGREKTEYAFQVFGTGFPLPEDIPTTFLKTVFDGPFVWHVYLLHL